MNLAQRLTRIEASRTLQVKEKAIRLKQQGIDVVDLTAGEPDFRTPDFIARAAIQAIEQGFTHYTENTGIKSLREAITRKLKQENQLEYQPEQIIVSNGAKQSIMNALFALLDEGDEVIIPLPYWVSYPEQVRMAGGKPVFVSTMETGFKMTPEQLEQHITPRTKAIILNSPNNPTGAVYSQEEIEHLAEVLARHDIWIISDEIYEKLIYDRAEHHSIATHFDLIDRTIVINGFSKAYAMTGWRIGYAAAPLPVVKGMAKIQSHYTSNASSISQRAALAALTGPQEKVEYMRHTFEERRNLLLRELGSRHYFSMARPEGAFYLFLRVAEAYGYYGNGQPINDSVSFATYLAEKYHLVVVPGIAFGADEYIRISFATSTEELERGARILIRAMEEMIQSRQERR